MRRVLAKTRVYFIACIPNMSLIFLFEAVFIYRLRNVVKDEWMDVECALEEVEIPIVDDNNIDKVGDCIDEK